MKKEIMDCGAAYGNGTKYRLIFNEQEYYIAKVWGNIFVTLFPFLIWFIPQTLYRITKEEKDQLLQETKIPKPQIGKTGVAIGGALAATSLLRMITSRLNLSYSGLPLQMSWIILGIQILLVICLVILLMSRKNENISLINRIFQEKKETKRVFLLPTFKRSGLSASPLAVIVYWLIFSAVGILMLYGAIFVSNNAIPLLVLPFFLLIMIVLPYVGFLMGKHYMIFK